MVTKLTFLENALSIYFMNYSRHLLCDVYHPILPSTPSPRDFNYRLFLPSVTSLVVESRRKKKGVTLFPDARTAVIRKFPSLIPFFKTTSVSNVDGTTSILRTVPSFWKVWVTVHAREDITKPEYAHSNYLSFTKDAAYAYVDDRLTFTKKQPKGAFFSALLKKVFRHVVQESVEDTAYKFVGEHALYRRFSAYSFRRYMEEERTHFNKSSSKSGCVELTDMEESQFDLMSLSILYETWTISERRFPRHKPLTELELIDLVFNKLQKEINRRARVNNVGGYQTELLALEQVRYRVIMLSELLNLLIHRSKNRSIFMHVAESTLETNKKDPLPSYDSHSRQLGLFDINFLKREKIYTKLKYSRSPAYDIVSGGAAALLAGFLGFLISEKFGIELVDSGDFYIFFMYGVFLTFSTRPLLKIMNQSDLAGRIWGISWHKYYIDSIMWLCGRFLSGKGLYLPRLHQLKKYVNPLEFDCYTPFYSSKVYIYSFRWLNFLPTSLRIWVVTFVRVVLYNWQWRFFNGVSYYYDILIPAIRTFLNELDGADIYSVMMAEWRHVWRRFGRFGDGPTSYSWDELKLVLAVWTWYFILLALTLLLIGVIAFTVSTYIYCWW